MTIHKWFASVVLASATVSTLCAETRCPGNVASVPLQVVNRYQVLLGVSINHSGPYIFLLDTGSQVTLVDLSLAQKLHFSVHDSANVISAAGTHASASFAQIDRIDAGSHGVTNQMVLVSDLKEVNSVIRPVQGILGEDFLDRFDMLIDNAHRMLCLDDSTVLGANVKGPRIAVITSTQSVDSQPAPHKLIVEAQLSSAKRPVRLALDSGSNGSVLYNLSPFTARALFSATSIQEVQVDGVRRAFSVLPPQEVIIGPFDLPRVSFIVPQGAEANAHMAEDGVLPTGLFRGVFVDHVNHSAILEPW